MASATQNSLAAVIAALLVHGLASCSSTFKLELPVEHPARAESGASGTLQVPDPFKVRSTSQPTTPMDESMEMGNDGSMDMGGGSKKSMEPQPSMSEGRGR